MSNLKEVKSELERLQHEQKLEEEEERRKLRYPGEEEDPEHNYADMILNLNK